MSPEGKEQSNDFTGKGGNMHSNICPLKMHASSILLPFFTKYVAKVLALLDKQQSGWSFIILTCVCLLKVLPFLLCRMASYNFIVKSELLTYLA
jgi:hypothetical protein